MSKQHYIITDPETGASVSVEATSSAEAVKKFKEGKKPKPEPKKEESEPINQVKNTKQS
jgi:hypothetical protein